MNGGKIPIAPLALLTNVSYLVHQVADMIESASVHPLATRSAKPTVLINGRRSPLLHATRREPHSWSE
jgi:hypothetical protein